MSVVPSSLPRPQAPRPRHLKVAPEVARRRRLTRLAMFAAGVVTVVSLFTMVAFQVFATQSAFTLDRLAKERTNEELRNQRLRAQVAGLSSPESIIARAQQLGDVPAPVSYVQAPPAAPKPATIDPAQKVLQSWPTTKQHFDDSNP